MTSLHLDNHFCILVGLSDQSRVDERYLLKNNTLLKLSSRDGDFVPYDVIDLGIPNVLVSDQDPQQHRDISDRIQLEKHGFHMYSSIVCFDQLWKPFYYQNYKQRLFLKIESNRQVFSSFLQSKKKNLVFLVPSIYV